MKDWHYLQDLGLLDMSIESEIAQIDVTYILFVNNAGIWWAILNICDVIFAKVNISSCCSTRFWKSVQNTQEKLSSIILIL